MNELNSPHPAPKGEFILEHLETQEEVREKIQECEGRHTQQVAYSTFHDCLTQICFTERKIRTNKKI